MRDIDQLLDEAGSDVHRSIRETTTPTARTVHRRARRRTAVFATGSVLVVGLALTGVILTLQGGGDVASTGAEGRITSERILEDGVVSEDEYRSGAQAVAACLGDAGFEREVDFDAPNGHASFFTPSSNTDPEYERQFEEYERQFDQCLDAHLSENVSLGWGAALGQIDLTELREETTAATECVEQRTGQDFGELTYDQFGYLTDQGRQTKDAAFEYQDHEPWKRCQNDLGYLEDNKAETRATLECVEERAGKDFGELTFDELGNPDEESRQTLRAAIEHQDHQLWEACQEDLGFQTSYRVTSDG